MKILLENSKNFNDSFKKILNSRKKIFSENVDEQVKNIIHEMWEKFVHLTTAASIT